jgi:exodeoxyribonuclease-3
MLIGCLYLPNGNPAPGPKFDYKLSWFKRLRAYAKKLFVRDEPVILAGDYNVIPTELDAYKPERWVDDALFFPESRDAYQKLLSQGWTDALRELHPDEAIYTFWDYFRNAYARNAGIRIDHFLLNAKAAKLLVGGGVEREVRGWEKSSDHAPTWITLATKSKSRARRVKKPSRSFLRRIGGTLQPRHQRDVKIDLADDDPDCSRLRLTFSPGVL